MPRLVAPRFSLTEALYRRVGTEHVKGAVVKHNAVVFQCSVDRESRITNGTDSLVDPTKRANGLAVLSVSEVEDASRAIASLHPDLHLTCADDPGGGESHSLILLVANHSERTIDDAHITDARRALAKRMRVHKQPVAV